MKKADYIAKYGEEAWAIKSAKDAKYNKMWREKHPDYIKQYYQDNKERIAEYKKQYSEDNKERIAEHKKQYYQDNKERFAERYKQWCQDNKEHLAEYQKQYYEDNKERLAEYQKQYYEDNKEFVAERMKQYRSTQWGRANILKNQYIYNDKERGFPTDQNIDEDWIIENIFGSQCIYCGESDWTKLGADRIDNSKPHTPDNCVCACWDCNNERNDKFTVEEFVQLMKKRQKGR